MTPVSPAVKLGATLYRKPLPLPSTVLAVVALYCLKSGLSPPRVSAKGDVEYTRQSPLTDCTALLPTLLTKLRLLANKMPTWALPALPAETRWARVRSLVAPLVRTSTVSAATTPVRPSTLPTIRARPLRNVRLPTSAARVPTWCVLPSRSAVPVVRTANWLAVKVPLPPMPEPAPSIRLRVPADALTAAFRLSPPWAASNFIEPVVAVKVLLPVMPLTVCPCRVTWLPTPTLTAPTTDRSRAVLPMTRLLTLLKRAKDACWMAPPVPPTVNVPAPVRSIVTVAKVWLLTVAALALSVSARRFRVVAVLLKLIGAFKESVLPAVRVAAPVAPV